MRRPDKEDRASFDGESIDWNNIIRREIGLKPGADLEVPGVIRAVFCLVLDGRLQVGNPGFDHGGC